VADKWNSRQTAVRPSVAGAFGGGRHCVEPAPSSPLNDNATFVKVMEYMALGKPVVAYDLPETRLSAARRRSTPAQRRRGFRAADSGTDGLAERRAALVGWAESAWPVSSTGGTRPSGSPRRIAGDRQSTT
jgi:hypothetical protein